MGIKLIEPTNQHREVVMAYREAFDATQIPGSGRLEEHTYQAWLERNQQLKTNPPDGLVPSLQYIALDNGGDLVGMIQLRLALNDYLENYGGHIGYSVHPEYRGNGYATEMVKLSLERAAQHGLTAVLITCDDSNQASARVIEKCGGVLEDKRTEPVATEPTRRYWISLD